MGWCSATPIFDDMVNFVIKSAYDDDAKVKVLKRLAASLEENDWDCQDDSDYREHPIVKRVMRELHPEWLEDDRAVTP